MLVDTHSHLNFKAYDKDREDVIQRTQKEGVVCIDIGTKYETSKNAIELAEKYDNIYAAIGMHPIHIKTDLMKLKMDKEEGAFKPLGEEYDVDRYRQLVVEDRKAECPDKGRTEGPKEPKRRRIVAIGEIGLDHYYRPKTKTKQEQFKEKQKQVFIQQLELAEELNLSVIIHCRSAFDDLYEILKTRKLKGVVHCFSGNWEEAQKYLDLGFYIGINGIIYKLDLKEVIEKTPLEKILLETDCPYLTPLPAVALAKAGPEGYARNEPIFVKYIAKTIAEIKKISFEQVAEITTANAMRLFRLDQSR